MDIPRKQFELYEDSGVDNSPNITTTNYAGNPLQPQTHGRIIRPFVSNFDVKTDLYSSTHLTADRSQAHTKIYAESEQPNHMIFSDLLETFEDSIFSSVDTSTVSNVNNEIMHIVPDFDDVMSKEYDNIPDLPERSTYIHEIPFDSIQAYSSYHRVEQLADDVPNIGDFEFISAKDSESISSDGHISYEKTSKHKPVKSQASSASGSISIPRPLHAVMSRTIVTFPTNFVRYVNSGDVDGIRKLCQHCLNDNSRFLVKSPKFNCDDIGSSRVSLMIVGALDAIPDVDFTLLSTRLYRKNGCRMLKWKMKLTGTKVGLIFSPKQWSNIEKIDNSGDPHLDQMVGLERRLIDEGKMAKNVYEITTTLYIDDFTNRVGIYELVPKPISVKECYVLR